MEVDELPGVDEYAQGLEDSKPHLVHRVCVVCVPEPHPGDQAVCGHIIKGCRAKTGDYPCLECARAWRSHVRAHLGYGRRG